MGYNKSDRFKALCGAIFSGRLFAGSAKVANDLAIGTGERESPEDCIFRKIVEGKVVKEPENIVYQDDRVFIIHDLYPSATTHLLVLPREPIVSVLSFSPCEHDIQLLEHMILQGKDALRQVSTVDDENKWWIGFHVPPMTSVDHLHMHCMSGKFNSKGNLKFKYNKCFYVDAEKVLERLKFDFANQQ